MPSCQGARVLGCQMPQYQGAGMLGITVLDARMLKHHSAMSAVPLAPCVPEALWWYQAKH